MNALFLGVYILVWPLISLAVLVLIVSAAVREFRRAKGKGQDVV